MRQCLGCSGLVPESSSSCPNCEVTAKTSGVVRKVVMATGTIAILSSGIACTPVYGAPCTRMADGGEVCADLCSVLQPDGGIPRNDPDNFCFTDGGTP